MSATEELERLCEVMHDAYEKAAVGAGWETQQASRKPWADVPEANKATMRMAVRALLEAASPGLLAAERERIAAAAEEMADELDWDGFMGDIVQSRNHAKDLLHRVAAIARGES